MEELWKQWCEKNKWVEVEAPDVKVLMKQTFEAGYHSRDSEVDWAFTLGYQSRQTEIALLRQHIDDIEDPDGYMAVARMKLKEEERHGS